MEYPKEDDASSTPDAFVIAAAAALTQQSFAKILDWFSPETLTLNLGTNPNLREGKEEVGNNRALFSEPRCVQVWWPLNGILHDMITKNLTNLENLEKTNKQTNTSKHTRLPICQNLQVPKKGLS